MCKYDLYTSNNKRYVETECSKPKKDTNVWQSRIKIVHCGVSGSIRGLGTTSTGCTRLSPICC